MTIFAPSNDAMDRGGRLLAHGNEDNMLALHLVEEYIKFDTLQALS